MKNYLPIIGLEVHVELKTKSKMFCQCSASYFNRPANSQTCPVCLGLPGALPVPNQKAIEWTILLGRALNCQINHFSKFDRKHYFYPDLPKGYQISQHDQPIAKDGWYKLKNYKGEEKTYKIRRVHLEEDTGKLIHTTDGTLIDFNRSGVPLVEIVSEPDFHNAEEVKEFLEELQILIRYLDISDADMEKGTMRLEPNISLICRATKQSLTKNKINLPNYKVEIKNINSFRFVKQAIEYEIQRQSDIFNQGKQPKQETRGYDAEKNLTYSLRVKEEAADYRYFPEPDIPPMIFKNDFLNKLFKKVPELPNEKLLRYQNKFKLNYSDAFILTRNKKMADYFELILNQLSKRKKEIRIIDYPKEIAKFIVNKKIAWQLSAEQFIEKAIKLMTPVVTDTNLLEKVIKEVIKNNSQAVSDYKKGKTNVLMYLVGQAMKDLKGKAEAKKVLEKIKEKLS
ncbi:MAG: Asp-tRNA(Asn)/Glu-tRNA(Gln) amidotransferase subunit GatB [Microgenomates group bacterium]|nr:Asp-tRNA(Asn)/Glu-tRNA(Gln) amidotransferase subunit GatB [Microgenomates group bacterium]